MGQRKLILQVTVEKEQKRNSTPAAGTVTALVQAISETADV